MVHYFQDCKIVIN